MIHAWRQAQTPRAVDEPSRLPRVCLRILAAAWLAVGCAPATPAWVKPGVTLAQLEMDRDDCLLRTDRYLATGDRRPDFDELQRCMLQKGYTVTRTR